MRTKQSARKSATQTAPYDSSEEDRPLADWRSQHRQHEEDSDGSGSIPRAARKPRGGLVRGRRALAGLAEADPFEQLGAPPAVPHPPAAAPARPGRQLPHGLQEPTLQAAVQALTRASQGTTAAEVEDALITTAEHHANFEEWLDQALIHIATVREVHDEAADLRAAMEVSLADAAVRRAAEAAEAAARPLSADLLSKRYGGCKVLSALLSAAPGEVLVLEPLIGPLKDLLHLERQCRGKWYPGPGTDHWFTTLAGDLAAEVQTMSASSGPRSPPPGALSVPASPPPPAAGAEVPAPEAGAEGVAADGAGLKRKRSSSGDGSSPAQGDQASPADAAGLSDQGRPANEDGPSSKRAAMAADAAVDASGSAAAAPADATPQDGQPAGLRPEASSGGSGSGSMAVPGWLPEFTQVVLQRLEDLQQQLALPEVKPPIFILPEGLAAQAAAQEDSDDDIMEVDMMDRKQSRAAQAAATAAAAAGGAAGMAAAAAADQVDLAE